MDPCMVLSATSPRFIFPNPRTSSRMRSRVLRAAVIVLYLLGGVSVAEPVKGLPDAVGAALVKAKIPPSGFSAYVQEIGQDKPILAFNAETPRNPASTIKLVT